MNFLKLSLILLILAIVVPSVAFLSMYSYNTYKVKKIPLSVTVDNYVGIDVTNKSLSFGTVPPGGRARKNVTIDSIYNKSVLVKINIAGDTKDWIAHEDSIILEPNETETISFIAVPPSNITKNSYNGTVIVSFHRLR